ncbi:uncharacterized protein SAPINGB_P005259 [Magnusiomyces paraingens]|uniref:Diphthine--ammonia ligase n=1 Tax=Magnusiomyces paraingens TaxID=2606893 RepID=A0A5E8C076_9ASCO|nr:uncharacterized protein SAPINGB_P005259 [Saprochaete ingens]VVT56772.1 unnamed protein product [Saprochaete ingens]
MKVVALVSGGKDSAFNMLHCTLQGHEIVALANLFPPKSVGSDEMDSFMYQTVGHSAVERYSECLDIPLYRQPITGTTVVTSLEYRPILVGDEADVANTTPAPTDETEDLYNLLKTVLRSHPEIKGVSVGAILSRYQRVRVENVCSRLGLTCLAFLWERVQAELLDEIIASGTDARLIKVAAYGLSKEDLGKSLEQLRPKLARLNAEVGLHLCGEGGEYETLVFDSPLFKRALVAGSAKVIEHSASDNVYFLELSDFHTKEKPGYDPLNIDSWKDKVAIPKLLDATYDEVLNQIKTDDDYYKPRGDISLNTLDPKETHKVPADDDLFYQPDKTMHIKPRVVVNDKLGTVWISNVTAPPMASDYPVDHVTALVFDKVRALLAAQGLTLKHVLFTHVLLKNMADFDEFNKVYGSFFGAESNPPARVCVENGALVHNSRVQLTVVATKDWNKRSGLHVQSRSYWAPANIGPYSQAVSGSAADGIIYFAGQIPLVPASMELLDAPAPEVHSVLALQHLNRVATAYQPVSSVPGTAPCYAGLIAYVTSPEAGDAVAKTWPAYLAVTSWAGLDEDAIRDASYYHGHRADVPLFIVQLTGLPKGAPIEWSGYGVDGDALRAAKAKFEQRDLEEEEADGAEPIAPYFFKPMYINGKSGGIEFRGCRFGVQAFASFVSDQELTEEELQALYTELFALKGIDDEFDAAGVDTGYVFKKLKVSLISGTLFYTAKAPTNGLLLNEVRVGCVTMLDRKMTNKPFGYLVRLIGE